MVHPHDAAVCLFPMKHSACWAIETYHLNDCLKKPIRPSSEEVFLWKSAKVPVLQCLINCVNEGINHLSHVASEWVKGGLLGPRAFEMAILVALSTKQPLLCQSDVKEGCDEMELWEQSPLQLLIMHNK